MNARVVNAGLVVLALAGCALVVRLVTTPLVRAALPSPARQEARASDPQALPTGDSLAAAFAARDPFRTTRRPALLAYDPARMPQSTTPAPSKPALTLVGIVWGEGHDPAALVDGLPGAESPRAVRLGESIGDLRVRAIGRDRVVIVGRDTTWTLTVREPWH